MRISMPGLYTEYDGTASRQFMLATALKTASLALSESRQKPSNQNLQSCFFNVCLMLS